MNRTLRYGVLALTFIVPWANLSARDMTLIAGTLVQCTVNEPNFSSRTAKINEPLVCYARPSREFGCSAFPRGTEFAGRLVDFRKPGRFYGKGWMQLEFDRLVIPEGETSVTAKVVSVHGLKVNSDGKLLGRGHPRRDAIEWSIPILWPVKLLTLPLRGPVPALKGERLITLRLLDDVQIPCGESLRAGWHYFGPSSWNHAGSSSSRDGFATDASLLRGEREALPTAQQQAESEGGSVLVIGSGHHKLFIPSSSAPKVALTPAPRE
jgi:hypothetical protein